MKNNPKLIAFAQAAGLTVYVALVVTFMNNMQYWLNPQETGEVTIGLVMLLLFIISALISSSIMLGYPAILLFNGKRKESLKIVFQSVGWLIVFWLLIISYILIK